MTVPRYLTPCELAARWRCRVSRIRAMVKAGELPAIRIGKAVRITPEAVAEAETKLLAVRPVKRQKREAIPKEVADILARA